LLYAFIGWAQIPAPVSLNEAIPDKGINLILVFRHWLEPAASIEGRVFARRCVSHYIKDQLRGMVRHIAPLFA